MILNLLNETSDSKFVARKWNIVSDQSNANYNVKNETIYNTEVSKSNLCDYNDACILDRGDITIAGRNLATEVAFTKIGVTTIDDAEDLDLVMAMYNLIEYSSNYSDGLILKMKKLILIIIILKMQIVLHLSSLRLNH